MGRDCKNVVARNRRIEFEVEIRREDEGGFQRIKSGLEGGKCLQGFEAREVGAIEVLDFGDCGHLLRRVSGLRWFGSRGSLGLVSSR